MSTAPHVAYFVTLVALTAAPGPLVAVVVARSLGRDISGAIAFSAGLCLGDAIAVMAVALGLGSLADARPEWVAPVKLAGVVYLLWLAVSMWKDTSGLGDGRTRKTGALTSIGAGVVLCLSNPATFLIYVLLLPTVAPAGISEPVHLAGIVALTLAAVGLVFFGTIAVARQFGRIAAFQSNSRLMGRGSAVALAATSLSMLAI